MSKINIKELLNDEFLRSETTKFSRGCLKRGLSIDTICAMTKEYIECYNDFIHIPNVRKKNFTMKAWWEIKMGNEPPEDVLNRLGFHHHLLNFETHK